MSELDQISRAIGRMEGTLEEVGRQCSALFVKYDSINEQAIEQRGAMKLIAASQDEMRTAHDALKTHVATEIKPAVEDFKTLKNRGIGALFGFGLVGGGLGASMIELAKRLMSGETAGPHSP